MTSEMCSKIVKSKNLKFPYTWENRRPLVEDGVFFVPDCYPEYENYHFPMLEELFENSNPMHLEYCSGNGEWVVGKAMENPKINWIAVEKNFDRSRKMWARMKRLGLTNLFIVSGEAMTFTRHYLKETALENIYINFPDPWPKKRHAKHRVLNEPFLDQLFRVLKIKGRVTFVTDDRDYSEEAFSLFSACAHFKNAFPDSFVKTIEGYGSSYFESLWRQKGKEIRYCVFEKQ